MKKSAFLLLLTTFAMAPISGAQAATNIPFTVTTSEPATVDTTGGTPRIPIDVGGTTRYASYASGSGTNTLTFTYAAQPGDLDLDGIAVSPPIDLNGGTIKDNAGNNATLTFTPPSTSGIKVDYPSLSMDFINNDYILSTTHYNTLTSFLTAASGTFTRASTATYVDNTGTIQTAATNTPRFDYDPVTHTAKGLLIEESRTNSIKNSSMLGVVTGTPGTIPTNWAMGGAGLGSLTQQIVSTGTENGVPYFDYRLSGTASTAAFVLYMNPTNGAAALSGQTWTGSVYTKVVSGSISNAAPYLSIYERDSSSNSLSSSSQAIASTGTLTRTHLTRTLSNAATAYVVSGITFSLTSGMPVDLTLRIAAPQLEQGAFQTSYIPTTTTALTRAADNIAIPSGSWLNQPAGALFVQAATTNTDTTNNPAYAALDDGTANNRMMMRKTNATFHPNLRLVVAGSNLADVQGGIVTSDANSHKIALGYQSGNNKLYFDNTFQTSYLTASAMPSMTQLELGNGPASNYLNGTLEKMKYYPARIGDTQLQLLTQ